MSFKFKFIGITQINNEKSEQYKINNTNVVVTKNKHSFEYNCSVDDNKMVLVISFSNRKGNIPQIDIEYILNHFGFDINTHYYTFIKRILTYSIMNKFKMFKN